MQGISQSLVIAVFLTVAIFYFLLRSVLAWRLRTYHNETWRRLGMPSTRSILFSSTWPYTNFVISGSEYKALNDYRVRLLVLAIRALHVLTAFLCVAFFAWAMAG